MLTLHTSAQTAKQHGRNFFCILHVLLHKRNFFCMGAISSACSPAWAQFLRVFFCMWADALETQAQPWAV